MAEVALSSEKSRNDTKASNNLQKIQYNLRVGCPPTFPTGTPYKEARKEPACRRGSWSALPCPQKAQSLAHPVTQALLKSGSTIHVQSL